MPQKYLNKLQGKRILVVGGTSGIGFAAAEAAVEYGANVVVASSKPEKVQNAIERLRKSYPEAADRVQGKAVDLSAANAEEQIVALFDFASEVGKHKLDHVIDTAGDHFKLTSLSELNAEKILALTKVRLVGALLLAKIASQYLNSSPTSSLTLTGGVTDAKPIPGWVAMGAVGAGKRGMTRALAHDMKPIRVNLVCPGFVKTEMLNEFPSDQLERIIAIYKEKALTGTVGKPEDLAEVYLSLMKNEFINGAEVSSDGGYLIS
jgi:NAD(P)-dependent dehydrogenase (short-subunit alcohol dehydrogenase family)